MHICSRNECKDFESCGKVNWCNRGNKPIGFTINMLNGNQLSFHERVFLLLKKLEGSGYLLRSRSAGYDVNTGLCPICGKRDSHTNECELGKLLEECKGDK